MARGAAARATSDGVQVFTVEGGSATAAAGLQAGDLIRSVDGTVMTDLGSLAAALDGDTARTLSVDRGGEAVQIVLP